MGRRLSGALLAFVATCGLVFLVYLAPAERQRAGQEALDRLRAATTAVASGQHAAIGAALRELSTGPGLTGVGLAVAGAVGLAMLAWPRSRSPRSRYRGRSGAPAGRVRASRASASQETSADPTKLAAARAYPEDTSRASGIVPAPAAALRPPAVLPTVPPAPMTPAVAPDETRDRPQVPPAPGPIAGPQPGPRRPFELSGDPVSAYWGLSEPAFDNSPNPKFLYRSPQHEEALARLLYAVEYRKGCAMLTGEYGCGKTMVSRALIGRLDRTKYELALLVNPTWNVVEFLREILYQCGVETAASSKPEVLRRINQVLLTNFRAARSTIIMVDEAQLIDDPAVLEELRLLLNFQTSDQFLMTLLLIGSVELHQRLRHVPHLTQRIAVRARIDPLSVEETREYIVHRLRVAGRRDTVFTEAAIARIFEASGGRPRMINNLCEVSLVTGCVRRLPRVDEDVIAEIEQSDGAGNTNGPSPAS